jgi:hypothetical protein
VILEAGSTGGGTVGQDASERRATLQLLSGRTAGFGK